MNFLVISDEHPVFGVADADESSANGHDRFFFVVVKNLQEKLDLEQAHSFKLKFF